MVFTRNYRTEDSSYTRITQPETQVGGVLRLTLPEPPSMNQMITFAKQRTCRTRNGGFMKKSLPVVYDQALEAYELEAMVQLDAAGMRPPAAPWERWSMLKVEFRLYALRDLTELLASLKWPVDLLTRRGWVKDDSPRHLLEACLPTQTIDREHRGVDLFIRRDG